MRALVIAIGLAAAAAPAAAKSEKTAPYDPHAAFPVAVRFLRVDLGVKIVEKDADTGYVIFELDEEKRTFRGALELVATEFDGRASVRLILRLDDRPDYEEQMMLDKLEQKLKAELQPSPKADKPDKPDKPAEKPEKK
jgi:hypothetical protein